jgi:hypothetical protein
MKKLPKNRFSIILNGKLPSKCLHSRRKVADCFYEVREYLSARPPGAVNQIWQRLWACRLSKLWFQPGNHSSTEALKKKSQGRKRTVRSVLLK